MNCKRSFSNLCLLLFSVGVFSCSIGTDTVDDEVIDVLINTPKTQLLVGETVSLSAKLKNSFQDQFDGPVNWQTDNPAVATVNTSGVLTAVGKGQTLVSASYNSVGSKLPLQITVIETTSEVASVVIAFSGNNQIEAGASLQLSAQAFDIGGAEITGTAISWLSSDMAIATVDATGLVNGLANGTVRITAEVSGVKSLPLELVVGTVARTGTFSGLSGYTVSGSVTISAEGNGLKITFGSDFTAQSGPGLFVYLSNNSNSVSGGLELEPLKANSGQQSYTVPGIGLNDYNYVLVHCKPFNVPFGRAQLN